MSKETQLTRKLSQKEKLDKMREIIDSNSYDCLFGAPDVIAMNYYTGWNKVAYRKIRNTAHPKDTRCVESSDDGENFEVWSWRKSVLPSNNTIEALRAAVADHIFDYRAGLSEQRCTYCSTTKDLTVDHVDPPFQAIAEDYEAIFGRPAIANDANGKGWYISDEADWSNWVEHHSHYAVLQLLCRSCNAKKGGKPHACLPR